MAAAAGRAVWGRAASAAFFSAALALQAAAASGVSIFSPGVLPAAASARLWIAWPRYDRSFCPSSSNVPAPHAACVWSSPPPTTEPASSRNFRRCLTACRRAMVFSTSAGASRGVMRLRRSSSDSARMLAAVAASISVGIPLLWLPITRSAGFLPWAVILLGSADALVDPNAASLSMPLTAPVAGSTKMLPPCRSTWPVSESTHCRSFISFWVRGLLRSTLRSSVAPFFLKNFPAGSRLYDAGPPNSSMPFSSPM